MKKIARSVYAVYGFFILILLSFVAMVALFLVFGLTGKRYEKTMILFCNKFCCRAMLHLMGIRVRVHCAENIDITQSYIVASNHQSILDIAVNAIAFPVPVKFLGKLEATRIPFFGYVIKRICVLLDRSSKESRKASYDRLKAEARKGFSVLIYVEGTRNRSIDPLLPFYDGAFRLSAETAIPIAVQTIMNSGQLASPHRVFDLWPGTIDCYWDRIQPSNDNSEESVSDLKEKCRQIMLHRLSGS